MIYKQKDFIKLVSEESGYYQNAIKDILDAIASVSERLMSESNATNQVQIRLFEGLTIGTKYYREREALNPRTGENIVTPEHIYPYTKYSQAFCWKIREACDQNKCVEEDPV